MVIRDVLVAFDFSEVSEAALAYARNMARTLGARLHVLQVMENDFLRPTAADPHLLAAAAERRLVDKLSDEDRHALVVIRKSDDPADEILQYARGENIGLIVIGTHGRTGMAHLLLGSVAEHVVRSASCPVLTVRHFEREVVTDDR